MFSESDARGSKRLLSDADTSEGEYPIVPPKASPWQVWCKYTELRYLFVSLMGSRFGSGIAEMAMMSIILAATIDSPQAVKTSMLGIPMASRGIVWASFALFGGIITDRYDNLKTMFLSDVCCIGSALLFLSLRPGMGVDTIKFLIPPLTVLHSVLGSPTYPAHKRWGSLLCEAHELDAVNGIVTTGALLGMAFGLGFGSVLAATFSTDVVFMIDATTYIVSAFSVYQIQCVYKARMDVVNPDWEIKQASERPSAPIGNCKTYLSFMMGGYQYCWQHKRFLLFYAITVSFFFPMVDTMLDVYLPEVATHMYGQDSATLFVGFMFLVECIGLAIMPHVATFVPTNTVGKRMVSQFVACVGMALCLTGVSFTPSDEDDVTTLVSVAYFGSLFVYGMAMCYTGLISTWWFQQSPPSVRGRVICIGHLAGSSSRFLGSLLPGLIERAFDLSYKQSLHVLLGGLPWALVLFSVFWGFYLRNYDVNEYEVLESDEDEPDQHYIAPKSSVLMDDLADNDTPSPPDDEANTTARLLDLPPPGPVMRRRTSERLREMHDNT